MERRSNVVKLPAGFHEAAMLQFARDQLKLTRACELFNNEDPFGDETMHAMVRQMLKRLASVHERNAARLVDLALAGAKDAHEALVDLISERDQRAEPLGSALTTYVHILADGPPRHRRPAVRPPENFLANFVIVCLLITLMRQFPALRLRRSTTKRPSACSIVSSVLLEAGIGRGSQESIRKIWERYGPPVTPGFNWNPQKVEPA